jgi:hypothetical protein
MIPSSLAAARQYLPLANSSHRQIINARGYCVMEIYSGACANLDEANELEALVVEAVNGYADLKDEVLRLRAALDAVGAA